MQYQNLNLGSNISDSRKRMGLSQEALAEKANVSLSTIQRIEKGAVKPRAFTIKLLAETLGLEISDLISTSTKNEDLELTFLALKKMNLATLLLAFLPFINLLIPALFWRKSKEIESKNTIAGKIVSFQLIWSIVVIIGMVISLFLTNLILGRAGEGLNIGFLFYLLAMLFNIFMIIKTTSDLNSKSEKALTFVPNLF